MKIAILSDIHDNLVNLAKALKWCQTENIETMFCCGDVTSEETLSYLTTNFLGKIYLVQGNIDFYDIREIKQYKNVIYLGQSGVFLLDKKIIGLCHEPGHIEEILQKKECDIVFYGHTHKPWEEKRGKTRIVNPGTVASTFSQATFAVWDNVSDNLVLKLINDIT